MAGDCPALSNLTEGGKITFRGQKNFGYNSVSESEREVKK